MNPGAQAVHAEPVVVIIGKFDQETSAVAARLEKVVQVLKDPASDHREPVAEVERCITRLKVLGANVADPIPAEIPVPPEKPKPDHELPDTKPGTPPWEEKPGKPGPGPVHPPTQLPADKPEKPGNKPGDKPEEKPGLHPGGFKGSKV